MPNLSDILNILPHFILANFDVEYSDPERCSSQYRSYYLKLTIAKNKKGCDYTFRFDHDNNQIMEACVCEFDETSFPGWEGNDITLKPHEVLSTLENQLIAHME